jgi:hypothetical protein
MTGIQKAEKTLEALSGTGQMSREQSLRFLDIVTSTTAESRRKWDEAPAYYRLAWRFWRWLRGLVGLNTAMPYHRPPMLCLVFNPERDGLNMRTIQSANIDLGDVAGILQSALSTTARKLGAS